MQHKYFVPGSILFAWCMCLTQATRNVLGFLQSCFPLAEKIAIALLISTGIAVSDERNFPPENPVDNGGRVGIHFGDFVPLTDEPESKAALVLLVEAFSPFYRVIHSGDYITDIDGFSLRNIDDIYHAVRPKLPGTQIVLGFYDSKLKKSFISTGVRISSPVSVEVQSSDFPLGLRFGQSLSEVNEVLKGLGPYYTYDEEDVMCAECSPENKYTLRSAWVISYLYGQSNRFLLSFSDDVLREISTRPIVTMDRDGRFFEQNDYQQELIAGSYSSIERAIESAFGPPVASGRPKSSIVGIDPEQKCYARGDVVVVLTKSLFSDPESYNPERRAFIVRHQGIVDDYQIEWSSLQDYFVEENLFLASECSEAFKSLR